MDTPARRLQTESNLSFIFITKDTFEIKRNYIPIQVKQYDRSTHV